MKKNRIHNPRKRSELRTLAELAAACDSKLPTVSTWIRRDWWRWSKRAPWEKSIVPDVLRAAAEAARGGAGRPVDQAARQLRDNKTSAEIRKLVAIAERAEVQLAKEKGILIEQAIVDQEWAIAGHAVRQGLENLPSQIVPLAITHGMPHEASAIFQHQIESLIDGALRHLSTSDQQKNEKPLAGTVSESRAA